MCVRTDIQDQRLVSQNRYYCQVHQVTFAHVRTKVVESEEKLQEGACGGV